MFYSSKVTSSLNLSKEKSITYKYSMKSKLEDDLSLKSATNK